jgi:hypothetical protein
MICPVCKEQGLVSAVVDRGTAVTDLGWYPHYDEAGVRHEHNVNRQHTAFMCSHGHRFSRYFYRTCSICDHVDGPEEIRVHT